MSSLALKSSAIAALLFFIVANPMTYNLTNAVLGSVIPITDSNGAPTQVGVIVHAVVYGLITLLIMQLGKIRGSTKTTTTRTTTADL